MHDLAEGLARFQQDVFPAKAELFARLATTHRPHTLFIGCSDARVVPELITQREPGELFVIRTAGNLVPPHEAHGPEGPGGPDAGDGTAASIEYAIAVLGVREIVVCGHSACGAMTALAAGQDLAELPAVGRWLRHAAPAGAPQAELASLIRDNVAVQLAHLATHPAVARALTAGTLTLHGWVYDIPTGAVERITPATGRAAAVAA
ncbi:carbonic anhydrase [Streptomyces sp. NPDC059456]|uniref:carbonic anhydrase n=1 Tax=Streptomyces sp. NPDC059456 TaxID=3346838 RepID=UPI0036989B4C